MELQKLLSYTRKAVDEYRMIEEGDHIAVGISGGKDSLTLLYALHGLKRFYPKKFELSAITVDLGFEDFDLSPIQALCQELNIPYRIESSDIYEILFHVRKESNPCSLCAKMRKGALNLRQLNHENPGVRERMFHAILDGNIEGWPERIIHPRA